MAAAVAGLLGVAALNRAQGQSLILTDPAGDVRILRTDIDADGYVNPSVHRLPDLLEIRVGRFNVPSPSTDRFSGTWDASGDYLRVEVVLSGLINPPGPVGFADQPTFDPFRFGPNPVFGFIELDMDSDENTGGEISAPDLRFAGIVGREGGLPSEPRFYNRIARSRRDITQSIDTPPLVKRSGEEFHLPFLGEDISTIDVRQEMENGDPALFESGEIWDVNGKLFHRCHAYERYSKRCVGHGGVYTPLTTQRYAHDLASDRTTITLVYPMTNAASAALSGPGTPVEAYDACDTNQNSVLEALDDTQFSAAHASPTDRSFPQFQTIAAWEFKTPSTCCLNPGNWRFNAGLGSAYETAAVGDELFVWTDVYPNPLIGDFNGDGTLSTEDQQLLTDFIAENDGLVDVDDDGDAGNGSIAISEFARNFSLFDTNYDGFVNAQDTPDVILLGDLDLNGVVDLEDVDDFAQALVSPADYPGSHNGTDPVPYGDFTGDGLLNGADIAGFVQRLIQG